MNLHVKITLDMSFMFGSSLCPVPVSIRHVVMRTRVQDWTRVRILMGPVITDHWTEAPPSMFSVSKIFFHL